MLRIQAALLLAEADLDHQRGALAVRRGKGGRRREVGMDAWGRPEPRPWLELRVKLPVGPLFCVINDPTRGCPWSSAAARARLRRSAVQAASGGASLPTSSGTPMPSNSRARVCR